MTKISTPEGTPKPKTGRGRKKTISVKGSKEIITKEWEPLPRTNGPVILPDTTTPIKQPTIVTMMKADFLLLQYKIFVSLMEQLQKAVNESITKKVAPQQLTLFQEFKDTNNIPIQIPIKNFGLTPDRYGELKNALKKMVTLPVTLDTTDPITGESAWLIKGIFEAIMPKKYSRYITLLIDKRIAASLVDVKDQGFTKYLKEVVMKAKYKYTVKIYLLISSWKDKGGFFISMKEFREYLMLKNKYKDFKDLLKRVIRPAYEELHEKADCWFEMSADYHDGEKEPFRLRFKVITAAMTIREKELLDKHKLHIEGILFRRFQLQDKQIQQILSKVTLANVQKLLEKIGELNNYIADNTSSIRNIPEYTIQSLLNFFTELEEEEKQEENN